MFQSTLSNWLHVPSHATPTTTPPSVNRDRVVVVSLFDPHGLAVLPWRNAGYRCVAYNPQPFSSSCPEITMRVCKMRTVDEIRSVLPTEDEIAFIVASPPCRDLSCAGARWWAKKRQKDPEFQNKEACFIHDLYNLLNGFNHVPFLILLPASSKLRTMFREPAFVFSPHHFAGYLHTDHKHPLFPDTVPTQDRYQKKTFVYCSPGLRQPIRRPLPPTFTTINTRKSGISKRTSPVLACRKHKHARHLVPLGFSTAIVERYASPQSPQITPHSSSSDDSSTSSSSSLDEDRMDSSSSSSSEDATQSIGCMFSSSSESELSSKAASA